MKRILLALCLLGTSSFAQPSPQFTPTDKPLPMTGTLGIDYATRRGTGPTDNYNLVLNVANSSVFKGLIAHAPYKKGAVYGGTSGRITYDMELLVLNPAITTGLDLNNPRHARPVGKIFGFAPIDENNVYRYTDGAGIKVAVFPMGTARGFESRFNGLALAKPPASSGFAKIKKEAVRLVSSKGGAITLTNYDKMEFQNHLLPAGPVQIYPETTVTGILFYDYGRSAWHFNNVNFVYNADGRRASDVLTGSIRWIEKTATYEFDIRVNEPPPSESNVFVIDKVDESAFFAQDENVPALTGQMVYKDTKSTGTVTASQVTINLTATKLSKQQTMMLAKLLLSAIVPINAE